MVNLTYSITPKGYKIFNNGILWITQEEYFPYSGDSMEEKAINHISFLKGIPDPQDEIENIKEKVNSSFMALSSNYKQKSFEMKNELPEEAGYFTENYREWKVGENYKQWELIKYNGVTVQVRQEVIAQEHQPPFSEGMTAIYIPYLVPDEYGIKTYKYGCSTKQNELFYNENKIIYKHVAVDNPSNIYPPSDDLPAIWKRYEESEK